MIFNIAYILKYTSLPFMDSLRIIWCGKKGIDGKTWQVSEKQRSRSIWGFITIYDNERYLHRPHLWYTKEIS